MTNSMYVGGGKDVAGLPEIRVEGLTWSWKVRDAVLGYALDCLAMIHC